MTDAAADTLSSIKAVQGAMAVMCTLQLTAFRYSTPCTPKNNSEYDYVIVGGGSAGSVLAYRLSADSSKQVLLIEAGDYPPLESEMPLLFTPIPKTVYDYDTCSVDDGYTAQNLQDHVVSLTQGKMLGGSSNIGHMIHVQGDPHDFNNWASILDDDSWNYTNVLPYFKKLEYLTDPDLLGSSYADLHGTDGMIKIERQEAAINIEYLKAFSELGHVIVDDTTSCTSIVSRRPTPSTSPAVVAAGAVSHSVELPSRVPPPPSRALLLRRRRRLPPIPSRSVPWPEPGQVSECLKQDCLHIESVCGELGCTSEAAARLLSTASLRYHTLSVELMYRLLSASSDPP